MRKRRGCGVQVSGEEGRLRLISWGKNPTRAERTDLALGANFGGMDNPNQKKLGYQRLDSWKVSMELADRVAKIAKTEPFKRCFDIQSQLTRSALSVPSNIAEGEERGSNRDALKFLFVARGSVAELRTQLKLAQGQGLIDDVTFQELDQLAVRATQLIYGMIRHRRGTAVDLRAGKPLRKSDSA